MIELNHENHYKKALNKKTTKIRKICFPAPFGLLVLPNSNGVISLKMAHSSLAATCKYTVSAHGIVKIVLIIYSLMEYVRPAPVFKHKNMKICCFLLKVYGTICLFLALDNSYQKKNISCQRFRIVNLGNKVITLNNV